MIQFREVDKSNYMDCLCLKVKESQKGFVADNAQSLVEARFEEGLFTRLKKGCSPGPFMPTIP